MKIRLILFLALFWIAVPEIATADTAERFTKALKLDDEKEFSEAVERAVSLVPRNLMCGVKMTITACIEKRQQFSILIFERRSLVIQKMVNLSDTTFYKTKEYKGHTGALAVTKIVEDSPHHVDGPFCVLPDAEDFRCVLLRATFLESEILKLIVEAHDRAEKLVRPFYTE